MKKKHVLGLEDTTENSSPAKETASATFKQSYLFISSFNKHTEIKSLSSTT